ncbi:MAG: DNA mismatch repair protein MutS [Legionella sp.]|nr:MAG: DNA mismatch repair protein MutS [Legionella sp.]PJD98516.1 MAG: DNA mismatch repair protein MutS [Legionella sp.]
MADDFLSDEDKALFRKHAADTKPLKKSPQIKTSPTIKPPPKPRASLKSPTVQPAKNYYLSDFIQENITSHAILSYAHPSFSPQRFKALKKGLIPWEARLDLHGLHAEAARDSLCHFIERQYQQQKRCLLIIHGKGGQTGSPPIIKNLVNRWLPQIDEVMAFHSALAKDGGLGAVYVYLKKPSASALKQ